MLMIVGPVAHKKQYDRIPMHDGIGAVSAFVHSTFIEYRCKGGTKAERHARAKMIAAEIGGQVSTSRNGGYHLAWVSFS
jgi:hypothetical protein